MTTSLKDVMDELKLIRNFVTGFIARMDDLEKAVKDPRLSYRVDSLSFEISILEENLNFLEEQDEKKRKKIKSKIMKLNTKLLKSYAKVHA